jgi:hypothetical protein
MLCVLCESLAYFAVKPFYRKARKPLLREQRKKKKDLGFEIAPLPTS